jgi:hypothetical protein
MAYELGVNLLANFLFLIIILMLSGFIYFFSGRRALLQFFGAPKGGRVIIYLSHLRLLPGGSVGVAGKQMSAQGTMVSYGEVEAARELQEAFRHPLPFFESPPEFLRNVFVADADVKVEVSPLGSNPVDAEASFVSLGSPAYNTASAIVQGKSSSRAGFENAERVGIKIAGVAPFYQLDYGFIQRIYLPDENRVMIYAAGLSEFATVNAARYLARNWRKLHKEHKGRDSFVILIQFDPANTLNPVVVLKV